MFKVLQDCFIRGTITHFSSKRHRILKEKVHIPRNSLLTDLFKEKQARTVYFVFIAISLCLCINALVESYTIEQR